MHGEDTALRARATAAGLFAAPETDDAPPPGDTLHLRLEELRMTQSELAVRTGLTPKHVSQLMNGLVPLTADVAQRLEYATGVPSRWWNRLEADYRSAQTRRQQQAAGEAHADWVRRMPVRHLVRAGVLPEHPAGTADRLRQLLSFFGVAGPEAYDALWSRPAAAFRQSTAHPVDGDAVAAWLRLGDLAAEAAQAADHDAAALRAALPELRRLTARPLLDAWPRAHALLASCGVAVVLVPEVPGARAYGATRWRARRAVVQLSLRGKTEDVFWLTLLHELGHVLLHGRRSTFVEFAADDRDADPPGRAGGTGPDGTGPDDPEAQAHRFALEQAYGTVSADPFVGLATDEDATVLADALGIGPGLVVARLHDLRLWDRRRGARLRRRTPSHEELLTGTRVAVRPRPERRPRGAPRAGDDGPA